MTRDEFIKKYEKHVYLGDSVYARFDGYHIILETINGFPDDPSNSIALEPDVIRKLLDYQTWLYQEAEAIEK